MTALTVSPNESSTLVITVDFLDLDGVAFTPDTCEWTLSDAKGAVINSRDRVSATVTGTSHDFVLSGEDLVYAVGASKGNRVFTVEGTYTSTYGASLPFRDEVSFIVINTVIDVPVTP